MLALAIMSHGENGEIVGDDGIDKCSVQSIVDALCIPSLKNVPKVKTYCYNKRFMNINFLFSHIIVIHIFNFCV